jgi:hypothetical protein
MQQRRPSSRVPRRPTPGSFAARKNSNKEPTKHQRISWENKHQGDFMSAIHGLPSSEQPNVLDPRIDLAAISSLPSSTKTPSTQERAVGRQSISSERETATQAGKKVWVARETSTQKMPSAFIVAPPPAPATRIGVDDLKVETQLKLNVNTNWSPLRGGELQIRYAPEMSNLGKGPIYQVRGAKSTVNIAASTWVEAAKEGVRISAGGALAPRTQNIVKSKPRSAETNGVNPTRRPPSSKPSPNVTKPFVPTRDKPIPESEKINPFDRPYEGKPYKPSF